MFVGCNANIAARTVGYAGPSQFGREFKRLLLSRKMDSISRFEAHNRVFMQPSKTERPLGGMAYKYPAWWMLDEQ